MIDEAVETMLIPGWESAGETRDGKKVELIVVVDDPRSGGQIAEDVKSDAAPTVLPNYFIDQDGAVYQFVADRRAGNGLELAIREGRRRNIDRIAVAIRLQRAEGEEYSDPQIAAVHRLLPTLFNRHGLDESSLATIAADEEGRARVFPYLPPAPPVDVEDAGGLLGAGMDPAQELWVFLYGETFKPRGGTLKMNQAFPLFAAKNGLGAPMAPNAPPAIANANYQVFARDVVFNLGQNWGQVQALSAHIDESKAMPDSGMVFELLKASYAGSLKQSEAKAGAIQGNKNVMPGWRFHHVAMAGQLGPAVSGNYVFKANQDYAFQVFAGDTLYTPMSDQAGCLYLSRTDPSDPAYNALWTETYKYCGAPYDPNSPFQKKAAELRLGTPLTGVYQAAHAGTSYSIQVFALDTLYAGPDGQVKRMNELSTAPEVQSYQPQAIPPTPPAPPPPPPTPAGAPRRDPNWPPFPDFTFLTARGDKRPEVLGRIQYVPANGDFVKITNNWAAENIIVIQVPELANIKGANGGKLQFHKKAAEQFKRFWAAVAAAGLMHLVLTFDGTWVPRTIRRNPNALSNHAYGTAFDINAQWNGFWKPSALVGDKGSVRELVPIANAHGFYWGGHWIYDKKTQASDGMHFEWAVPR